MKQLSIGLYAGLMLAATLSFMIGRIVEDFRTGYHYESSEDQKKTTTFGEVFVRHDSLAIGFDMIDTGFANVGIRLGDKEITVCQVKEQYNAEVPHIDNVEVQGETIEWRDGIYRYRLKISPRQQSTDRLDGSEFGNDLSSKSKQLDGEKPR